jgi:hypothetical protein
MADNYGLNNNFSYLEFELDSSQFQFAADGRNTGRNYPMFSIAGKQPLKNLAAVKILEVQIPYSWYTLTDAMGATVSNPSFVLYVDSGSGIGTGLVQLTPGNYDANTMAAHLQSRLNAAAVVAAAVYGGAPITFVVTFDFVTQKFVFSRNALPNFSYQFGFAGTPLTSPFEIFGFQNGLTGYFPTAISTSQFVAQLSGPNYLYVNSIALGNVCNVFLPGLNNSIQGNKGPQMCKVPVSVSPGGVIFWSDPDPQKWFDVENLASLTQVDFYLSLGTNPAVLDLNGLSFSLKLGVLLWNEEQRDYNMGGNTVMNMKRSRQ